MQTITRHGGGSHWVRPDRVYRTGVLTSTMGYDPGADVQDVAAAFTQYPMDLQAPGFGGLGALGAGNGLIQRFALRFKAWRARRQASAQGAAMSAMAPGQAAMGMGDGDARNYGVAYPQVGMSLVPFQEDKAAMANHLMSGGQMPEGFARAQAGFSWDRWWNMRWNG